MLRAAPIVAMILAAALSLQAGAAWIGPALGCDECAEEEGERCAPRCDCQDCASCFRPVAIAVPRIALAPPACARSVGPREAAREPESADPRELLCVPRG